MNLYVDLMSGVSKQMQKVALFSFPFSPVVQIEDNRLTANTADETSLFE